MCDCHKRMTDSLMERFKEAKPEAEAHRIELQGYGFAIVDNTMTLRPFMNYKAAADFPLKKGGTKWKQQTGILAFSFCPFCGEAIDPEARTEPVASGADTPTQPL